MLGILETAVIQRVFAIFGGAIVGTGPAGRPAGRQSFGTFTCKNCFPQSKMFLYNQKAFSIKSEKKYFRTFGWFSQKVFLGIKYPWKYSRTKTWFPYTLYTCMPTMIPPPLWSPLGGGLHSFGLGQRVYMYTHYEALNDHSGRGPLAEWSFGSGRAAALPKPCFAQGNQTNFSLISLRRTRFLHRIDQDPSWVRSRMLRWACQSNSEWLKTHCKFVWHRRICLTN